MLSEAVLSDMAARYSKDAHCQQLWQWQDVSRSIFKVLQSYQTRVPQLCNDDVCCVCHILPTSFFRSICYVSSTSVHIAGHWTASTKLLFCCNVTVAKIKIDSYWCAHVLRSELKPLIQVEAAQVGSRPALRCPGLWWPVNGSCIEGQLTLLTFPGMFLGWLADARRGQQLRLFACTHIVKCS